MITLADIYGLTVLWMSQLSKFSELSMVNVVDTHHDIGEKFEIFNLMQSKIAQEAL